MEFGKGLLRPTIYTAVLAPLLFLSGLVLTHGDSRWYGNPVSYVVALALAANPITALCVFHSDITVNPIAQILCALLFLISIPISLRCISGLFVVASEAEPPADSGTSVERSQFAEAIRETLKQPMFRYMYLLHAGYLPANAVSISRGNSMLYSMLSAIIYRTTLLAFAGAWVAKFRNHEEVEPFFCGIFTFSVLISHVSMQLIERRALVISSQESPKEGINSSV